VTETQVLVGLPSGHIFGIQKKFLDARRPTNSKAAAHAEGVMPYHPLLVLPHTQVINYNRTIARIDGFHVATTALESTCLVFVSGLDIFFTHAMPSQRFDALSEDFPIPMLITSLIALFGATIFARQYSNQKILARVWA